MITRVRARNFKSLRDVDISLGPLNVLVGPNMGGKSNVLDLFRFLYECWFPQPRSFGPGGALTRRQGIEEVLWKGGQEKEGGTDAPYYAKGLNHLQHLYAASRLATCCHIVMRTPAASCKNATSLQERTCSHECEHGTFENVRYVARPARERLQGKSICLVYLDKA
jgi:predicted ATPase